MSSFALVARLDEAQQEVTRRKQEREIRESNALIANAFQIAFLFV